MTTPVATAMPLRGSVAAPAGRVCEADSEFTKAALLVLALPVPTLPAIVLCHCVCKCTVRGTAVFQVDVTVTVAVTPLPVPDPSNREAFKINRRSDSS